MAWDRQTAANLIRNVLEESMHDPPDTDFIAEDLNDADYIASGVIQACSTAKRQNMKSLTITIRFRSGRVSNDAFTSFADMVKSRSNRERSGIRVKFIQG
jgi:hypothetical protein